MDGLLILNPTSLAGNFIAAQNQLIITNLGWVQAIFGLIGVFCWIFLLERALLDFHIFLLMRYKLR